MFKKSKLTFAASLIVQSITFFVLYLVNVEKKKNLAKAFAAFAAIGGVSGAVFLPHPHKSTRMQSALRIL